MNININWITAKSWVASDPDAIINDVEVLGLECATYKQIVLMEEEVESSGNWRNIPDEKTMQNTIVDLLVYEKIIKYEK